MIMPFDWPGTQPLLSRERVPKVSVRNEERCHNAFRAIDPIRQYSMSTLTSSAISSVEKLISAERPQSSNRIFSMLPTGYEAWQSSFGL
jgi:hypothetical protein